MKPIPLTLPPAPGLIRVGVVDDDERFRVYVESFFAASARHDLVLTAGSVAAAAAWPADRVPHVVLVDMRLADGEGPAVVRGLVAKYPGVLCLMLTGVSEPEPVLEAVKAGAVGYLLKGGGMEAIMAAIDDALGGGAPMSPAIARIVLGLMQGAVPAPSARQGAVEVELNFLTARELAVLERVAEGATDKEVSEQLQISSSTVKNTLLSIYAKWRVRSRTEAAVKFVRVKARQSHGA